MCPLPAAAAAAAVLAAAGVRAAAAVAAAAEAGVAAAGGSGIAGSSKGVGVPEGGQEDSDGRWEGRRKKRQDAPAVAAAALRLLRPRCHPL